MMTTHDKLVKAYLEYFKANEQYREDYGSIPRRETRRWLREIRDSTKIRMNEVQDSYVNLEKIPKKTSRKIRSKYPYAMDLQR